jgi:uncharacterized protein
MMKKTFLSMLVANMLACLCTLSSSAQSANNSSGQSANGSTAQFANGSSVSSANGPSAQFANKIKGDWVGVIGSGGAGLPLIFHITGDSLSGYQVTLDNPLRNFFGVKCNPITYKGDSLVIETIIGPKITYLGKYQAATDSVYGFWYQEGQVQALRLKRMLRPQMPRPPFPYRADSVEYDNAAKTVHLGATFTRPLADKKYPVAILITGSGLQDRDETLFGHKPFAVIADYLTRHGIAVLRVDDRTMGKSTGDVKSATTSDYADDVLAGINYLKTRSDIDTTRIGLIGHSEGGLIGPIAYSRWPHLKFMIMLAGPGIQGSEIMLRQQTDPLKPISMRAFDAYYPLVKKKLQIMNDTYGAPDSVTLNQIKAFYAQWKSGVPDSILVILHAKDVSPAFYGVLESAEMRPWLRYFYKTDPAYFLKQVKCPVLALDGEKDTQVYPEENIAAIKAALAAGGNTRVTTRIFPGLNHLFQHCHTGQVNEYPTIDESFAPEVLVVMGDWVRKVCNL